MPNCSGIILYDKKPGITSFSALGKIKKVFGTKKIGHTGTLDSFAQGLLVVCAGSLTRLAGLITAFDKEYEALIVFGERTDTLDPTGRVVQSAPLPSVQNVERAFARFAGKISQRPPEYSAIKVGGKRMSDLAREGRAAPVPERQIEVYKSEIISIKEEGGLVREAEARFLVSKGTYIRSLARDIGEEAGSCARLERLKRTRVGSFSLLDAADEESLSVRSLRPMDADTARLCGLEPLFLREGAEGDFYNGRPLRDSLFKEPPLEGKGAVFDGAGNFLGAVQKEGGRVRYEFVVPKGGPER